jgi:hypothetical protein
LGYRFIIKIYFSYSKFVYFIKLVKKHLKHLVLHIIAEQFCNFQLFQFLFFIFQFNFSMVLWLFMILQIFCHIKMSVHGLAKLLYIIFVFYLMIIIDKISKHVSDNITKLLIGNKCDLIERRFILFCLCLLLM